MATASGRHARPDLEVEPVAPMSSVQPGMASPTGSLMSAPFVNPAPAYIAAKEAAFITTREVLVEFHQVDETDVAQMQDSSLSQVSQPAIANVNAFLDRILLNILSNARSLSLVSLRPAVRDVLRPKLAQEAITGADEELIECIDEEDEAYLFEDVQETPDTSWDLDLAWKRARLRCMVYTRLGDMEEEDEDRYLEENGIDNYTDSHIISRSSSVVTPPVAIWLTAILEFIGENVLIVASHAAYKRCENKYGRGIAGQPLHPSVVMVGENDLEKIALSPILGRLWRSWRKPIRSPKTSISRALSIDSMRHRRMDSRSSTGVTRKTSSETLNSTRPDAGSKRGSQQDSPSKESPVVLDPASIALPMSEYDIYEIEIPWFVASARNSVRPSSFVMPDGEGETQGEESSPEKERALRRMRSGSFPSTKWDFETRLPRDITITAKSPQVEQRGVPVESSTAEDTARNGASKPEELAASTAVANGMSGTMTDPTEFQAPAEVPRAENRLSAATISQRRRSKRLSYQSGVDRKSHVSDASESNGPALFSRSDYRIETNDRDALRDITTDAPKFSTNVVAPTPRVDQIPTPMKSEKRRNRLSAQYADAKENDAGYESGEVSPLEPSDDEGSTSIAGLRDAQEHMGVPQEQPQSRSRPISMDRPVSPLVEDPYDEGGTVSPMSPDEHGYNRSWPHVGESPEISPIEHRRKPVLPQTGTAPYNATVPAVAPAPITAPVYSTAQNGIPPVATITSPPVTAPAFIPQSSAPGQSVPVPRPQASEKRESDEWKREARLIAPGVTSPEVMDKGMPDIPKEAQVSMLQAAAAAHANVAVPQPESLDVSARKRPGLRSREPSATRERDVHPSSQERQATGFAPPAPPKDAVSPQHSGQPVRARDASHPMITSEPVITAVTPVPGLPISSTPVRRYSPDPPPKSKAVSPPPSTVTNVTVHRKAPSRDRPPVVTPLNLGSSNIEPTPSGLLERRRQSPPQAEVVSPEYAVAKDSSAVNPSDMRRQLPQVDTDSPDRAVTPERAAVQRLSPSPTSANDPSKQLPPRSIPETVQANNSPFSSSSPSGIRRKPASRGQSKSGEELLYAGHETQVANPKKAEEFNQLIDSGETIQYTLTPQHLRNNQAEKWTSDVQAKPAPMDRNRSYSGSNGTSVTKTKFAGFPVKIPLGAIRSGSRPPVTGKNGLAPRDAKTVSESIREFADFMRNTGPDPNLSAASTANTAKRGPKPVRDQDIAAKPTVATMPMGARSPTGTSMRIGSSGGASRRSGPKLVARDAQATGGVSDLINFIRDESGPASGSVNGNSRMGGGASWAGSVNSTQESFKGSVNSNTGLLSSVGGGRAGGRGYMSVSQEEPMMPVRKSRKPRDPYAIDDDEDILEEDEIDGGGGGNEESLADFLNSQSRTSGGLSSHPPRVSSASTSGPTTGLRTGGNVRKSSIGRPIGPGGVPNRQSLLARGAAGGGGSTMDLADFLKSSGPPAGTISRVPEEPEKKSGKLFGRRQRA